MPALAERAGIHSIRETRPFVPPDDEEDRIRVKVVAVNSESIVGGRDPLYTPPLSSTDTQRVLAATVDSLEDARDLLPGVPPAHKLSVSAGKVRVALHELGHAIVGNSLNMTAGRIRVISEEEGVTTFPGGAPNKRAFAKVAAAGAAETGPKGAGSDFAKIAFISGWQSVRSNIQEAKSIIAVHPPRVRARAARFLAYLGEIPGSRLGELMARAYHEERMVQRRGKFSPVAA